LNLDQFQLLNLGLQREEDKSHRCRTADSKLPEGPCKPFETRDQTECCVRDDLNMALVEPVFAQATVERESIARSQLRKSLPCKSKMVFGEDITFFQRLFACNMFNFNELNILREVRNGCESEEGLVAFREEMVVFNGFSCKVTFAEQIEGFVGEGSARQADIADILDVEICYDVLDQLYGQTLETGNLGFCGFDITFLFGG
jgi:hypothetical protein